MFCPRMTSPTVLAERNGLHGLLITSSDVPCRSTWMLWSSGMPPHPCFTEAAHAFSAQKCAAPGRNTTVHRHARSKARGGKPTHSNTFRARCNVWKCRHRCRLCPAMSVSMVVINCPKSVCLPRNGRFALVTAQRMEAQPSRHTQTCTRGVPKCARRLDLVRIFAGLPLRKSGGMSKYRNKFVSVYLLNGLLRALSVFICWCVYLSSV